MNKEYFEKFFYYDETSKSCLRWKIWNNQHNESARFVGDEAGYINASSSKYKRYKVGLCGKEYMVHQIVWCLHNDSIPEDKEINHLNCNPSDNRIDNLELCSKSQNASRKKMHKNGELMVTNTSGHLGVRETIVERPSGRIDYYAHAFVKINGKCIQKKFNYTKHGKELAWKLAKEFREETFRRIYDL